MLPCASDGADTAAEWTVRMELEMDTRSEPTATIGAGDTEPCRRRSLPWIAAAFALGVVAGDVAGQIAPAPVRFDAAIDRCGVTDLAALRRNPTHWELRCRYGIVGTGRFGLLSYMDVPVYQPRTPLPGTHVVGVPGMPRPRLGESHEEWEWRVLRTVYGAEAHRVHRDLELLDPLFAARLLRLERESAAVGIRAYRRESWRSPERQAFLFQQGRSRPGPIATATLTSWHSRVDGLGRAAGRAADYTVPYGHMERFHQIAASIGLQSYGADSNDPGHVFLPDPEALPVVEVTVLRLLPRVPHVTLATGRPEDEPAAHGFLPLLQQQSREFASTPFFPLPSMELGRPRLDASVLPPAFPTRPLPRPPRRRIRGR